MTTTEDELMTEEFLTKGDVETEIPDMKRTQREKELQEWDKQKAQKIASSEDVELTDEHYQVIHLLRDYYLEHGAVESGRELGDMLDEEFADKGGRKYLRKLFPQGPVGQGMRFSSLPVPAHTEDDGFGTSR